MKSMLRGLVIGCALMIGAGCSGGRSGPAQAAEESALVEVGELIRATTTPNGRGPSKLADLDRHQSMFTRGYQAVKSGEIVVIWGAKMADEGDAATAPKNVVAYEKKAETEGGRVLLQNGTVKEMTADEFKAAPKAK